MAQKSGDLVMSEITKEGDLLVEAFRFRWEEYGAALWIDRKIKENKPWESVLKGR